MSQVDSEVFESRTEMKLWVSPSEVPWSQDQDKRARRARFISRIFSSCPILNTVQSLYSESKQILLRTGSANQLLQL